MALTGVDRAILQRCLHHESGSWNDFVDRFIGLIYHTIHYTAHLRSNVLKAEAVEDLAQEILSEIAKNDYALLRAFRGKSSLATYLTVLSRRIAVRELARHSGPPRKALPAEFTAKAPRTKSTPVMEVPEEPDEHERISMPPAGMEGLDQLQKLIRKLPAREREVARLFYFEGRSYEDISMQLDLPVRVIGPILKRARQLLRKDDQTQT